MNKPDQFFKQLLDETPIDMNPWDYWRYVKHVIFRKRRPACTFKSRLMTSRYEGGEITVLSEPIEYTTE
jgi:hypothetical protein